MDAPEPAFRGAPSETEPGSVEVAHPCRYWTAGDASMCATTRCLTVLPVNAKTEGL